MHNYKIYTQSHTYRITFKYKLLYTVSTRYKQINRTHGIDNL